MQLTKFSKLKIIHTPGKNLTVADMLSRTFTKEQLQIHQLRHKQLPPQIDFSIMKDNQLKPVHYLVKHEEIKYNQKNDCHPILADYGEDQFSIRINNKREDIRIKPLDSFSFQSTVPFESKYKRPTKNQAKSLLQQSTILNDTDILSDEDEPNLNPFFHKILSKPIAQWMLATETAMIQLYHTVYENTKRKINSFDYFNKTYNNPRPLDIGTFVLKRNFLHVHFSDKLKPLRIGPFEIIYKISDNTYEIVIQDG